MDNRISREEESGNEVPGTSYLLQVVTLESTLDNHG